jgi:hypothetical protein
MGLNTIFSIITWLLYVLQCMPLDAIFHPAAHPKAKCVDRAVLAFAPTGFVSLFNRRFQRTYLTPDKECLHRYSNPHPPNSATLANPS